LRIRCVWAARGAVPVLLKLSREVSEQRVFARMGAGPVENSEEGMAADAAVLEAELDLDRLCAVGGGTEASKESKH